MNGNERNDLSSLSGEQLQTAVNSILQDPGFGRLLSELQGNPPEAPAAVPQITPEMMARLPQMMSALAPLVSQKKGEPAKNDGKKDGETEKRRRLLAALRPYLSSGRQDAVDGILKITEMTDLLSSLGQPGPDK